jgi:serine/threonine-protein kinase
MSPASARKIGSFEIERELGQGGMGVVYLARQPDLERRAVLKTLRRDLSEDPTLEQRFRREARAAASVHHQNVVAVYDCFAWRSERFIAQEYVEGEDLSAALRAVPRLSPRVAALIALELARGLEEIHARGIVHRDLKPSNVLLGHGGETKIADFGIALDGNSEALTQTGHALGTPLYMSPEQLLGERADIRSDLFSLGVVLYEMLTGKTPFAEAEPEEGDSLLRRIQAGRFASPRKLAPETPRALVRLVRACLRAKPKRRIPSATAARRALERHLGAPSPADCRKEIAAWLWERKVFRPGRGRTARVKKHRAQQRPWAVPLRWVAATAAACAALAAAAVAAGLVDPDALDVSALLRTRGAAGLGFQAQPQTEISLEEPGDLPRGEESPSSVEPGSGGDGAATDASPATPVAHRDSS